MQQRLASLFPPHIHPLTIVSDPDGVLGLAERAELQQAGFRLIEEPDPIKLRLAIIQAGHWTPESPMIIHTSNPLNTLAYDLWQSGHHVELNLGALWPNLDAAAVRELTPEQRALLDASPAPPSPLGTAQTRLYVLQTVFALPPTAYLQPAGLYEWLRGVQERWGKLPQGFHPTLIRALEQNPALAELRLANILDNPTTKLGVPGLREESAHYVIAPRDPNDILERLTQLLTPETQTWREWQQIARLWAELGLAQAQPRATIDPQQRNVIEQLTGQLDQRFLTWLQLAYARLAGKALPEPHHLHHVLGWLKHMQAQDATFRPALLVWDGMSLANWLQIKPVWQRRHETWSFQERLVLAQIPSITAVSRQSLVSGLPPRMFVPTIDTNRAESKLWRQAWEQSGEAAYVHLGSGQAEEYPSEVSRRRVRAVCLITTIIDDLIHGATQGISQIVASLDLWLHHELGARSGWYEQLIQQLLDNDYTVVIASDHGHVAATGMGQPHEGVLVQSRGQRARLYPTKLAAESIQQQFPQTTLWGDDGVLPTSLWSLMPAGRRAFAQKGLQRVSHGGLTIDEMIVPLVMITQGETHG
jgi:hypothetical protein